MNLLLFTQTLARLLVYMMLFVRRDVILSKLDCLKLVVPNIELTLLAPNGSDFMLNFVRCNVVYMNDE